MMNEPRTRPLPLGGHDQSAKGQLGAHMIAHGPADHLPGRQIQHGRQVEPALTGWNVRDVGQPDPVRHSCRELLLQQVRRNRQRMATVGRGRPETASGQGSDPMPAHQPLDPAAADPMTLGAQGGMHARAAITALMLTMEPMHLVQQAPVGKSS
jgi:hypothetical protein